MSAVNLTFEDNKLRSLNVRTLVFMLLRILFGST